MTRRAPRVAIACSGLGHIRRGIESWATDLSSALRRAGVDVTLFGAGAEADAVALPCLRRTTRGATGLARALRHLGGWRYGFGSPYEVEQTTFCLALWRRIRRGYDILHVQDPLIAAWFERLHRAGLSEPRVIYANGTGEGAPAMRRFAHLQLLTPQSHDAWKDGQPPGQSVFMVPNFIDTTRFSPGDRSAARATFGLPRDRLIVLCCAAIRRYHKRIDYLLSEFADALARTGRNAMLVIAGGRETDTDALIAAGESALGDRVRFFVDMPRARMPDLYRAADLFALASLHEMFGIVLVEAMACGLPVLCHDAPAFRTVVGPAGLFRDMTGPGGLAGGLTAAFEDEQRDALSAAARRHAAGAYAEDVVVRDILRMYDRVVPEYAHG